MKNVIMNGCIIGLDITFNVSSCYITVVCFKNKNVIKMNTSEPPIMLDPIVMPWDGNFGAYHRFISHLKIKPHNIAFGTDEDAAVIKAITACFQQATHILCIWHLKENARENLR